MGHTIQRKNQSTRALRLVDFEPSGKMNLGQGRNKPDLLYHWWTFSNSQQSHDFCTLSKLKDFDHRCIVIFWHFLTFPICGFVPFNSNWVGYDCILYFWHKSECWTQSTVPNWTFSSKFELLRNSGIMALQGGHHGAKKSSSHNPCWILISLQRPGVKLWTFAPIESRAKISISAADLVKHLNEK